MQTLLQPLGQHFSAEKRCKIMIKQTKSYVYNFEIFSFILVLAVAFPLTVQYKQTQLIPMHTRNKKIKYFIRNSHKLRIDNQCSCT